MSIKIQNELLLSNLTVKSCLVTVVHGSTCTLIELYIVLASLHVPCHFLLRLSTGSVSGMVW